MVGGELARRIARDLPGWRIEDEKLTAIFRYGDFAGAFAAATRVAFLAERAGHHPDLTVGWGRLEIRLTTHSEGCLTEKDVELASETTEALGHPSASSSQ